MSLTTEQIAYINDMSDRLESAESALDAQGNLAEKLDGIDALAKNFDFGSELAQLKQAMTQVFGFLGIAPEGGEEQGGMPGAAPQFAAEGGVEKGDTVIELHEHSDARKKEGLNFAAALMPVPGGSNSAPGTVLNTKSLSKSASGEVTLMGVLGGLAKRLDALEGTTGGRTSAEVTGEPVAKRAGERALFAGKF